MTVAVRRSAWRMWTLAISGVPLVVVAVDILTQRKLTDALRELLFRPDDTQIFEPRDHIWAWLMLVVGLLLTGWGLKELVFPSQVLRADGNGLSLKVAGPFRPSVFLPWDSIDDIGEAMVDDEGTAVPVLWVKVHDPSVLPAEPWGARLVADDTLAMLASDWERPPGPLAEELADIALASVRAAEPEDAS